jgi:hypothetical protein
MKRIYHNYLLWEDYKAGFYDIPSLIDNKEKSDLVKDMFSSEDLTLKFMTLTINEWFYSCEHNLTNMNMNRVAYIGQAACCLFGGVPNLLTMKVWNTLDREIRDRSDNIAESVIKIWELEKRLKNTLVTGSLKDTEMVYQMKLQLS